MANGAPPPRAKPKVATLDQIKQRSRVKEETVTVEGWGDAKVRIRQFSKAGWRQLLKDAEGEDGKADPDAIERLMVLRGVVEPQFEEGDLDELWAGASDGTDELLGHMWELVSGMDGEALAHAARLFRAS